MKAAVIERYGDAADVLRVRDMPKPEPQPDQVRVRQVASSLNPIDCRVRDGYGRIILTRKRGFEFPLILGRDVSGIVDAVGRKVRGLQVGDAVFGAPDGRIQGAHAEYVVAPASQLVSKPAKLSFEEAASLPYVAGTAWAALIGAGGLQPDTAAGLRVFVQGGAGGVGGVAIQMLKAWGAQVATTCSGRNVEAVRALGADVVIDYETEDFASSLEGYDLALDTVGGTLEEPTLSILRRDGGARYVTVVHPLLATFDEFGLLRGGWRVARTLVGRKRALKREGIGYTWALYRPDRAALDAVSGLVGRSLLQPRIARVFSLDDIIAAHQFCESGLSSGKVIVKIAEPGNGPVGG